MTDFFENLEKLELEDVLDRHLKIQVDAPWPTEAEYLESRGLNEAQRILDIGENRFERLRALAQNPHDVEAHDIAGPLPDGVDRRLAVEHRQPAFLDVAIAAKAFHRLADHRRRRLAHPVFDRRRHQPGEGGFGRIVVGAVVGLGKPEGESGAGQIALIGMPNSGKSSIVGALTNAKVNIADYPFATSIPVPGMAHYEDVSVQVVDSPPVTADYAAPGQVNTYRGCDFIGIVIDLSADVLEQMEVITA